MFFLMLACQGKAEIDTRPPPKHANHANHRLFVPWHFHWTFCEALLSFLINILK